MRGTTTLKQLFARKSLQVLLDEMAGEHRLRRVLGPVTLTSLGIGAVIGAGIFVATGAAANSVAGPALMAPKPAPPLEKLPPFPAPLGWCFRFPFRPRCVRV